MKYLQNNKWWFSLVLFILSAGFEVKAQPDLMLLAPYTNQDVTGWLVSEKLDGVRAYWDGKHLVSRQGNKFAAPDWFTKALPPFALDGELWLGRGQFEQTLSIVRQQNKNEGWKEITYQIFDLPTQAGGLKNRLNILQIYLANHRVGHLQIIDHYPLSAEQSISQYLAKAVMQGAEGLVLREPNVVYQSGRSPYALKVKPKYDAECTVTGYSKGEGKYAGLVGALICVNEQQQRLKLGSGLTDVQRADPPKIGSRISYQYSGYTQSGLPRHTIFWRVRPLE